MKQNEDRRIRYTKALLRDALVELLQECPISKISVKTLCEKADVHRTTFYAHYKDQYDLLEQIQKEVLNNIRAYIEEGGFDDKIPINQQKLTRILEYGKENANLIRVLLGDYGDTSFQKDIMDLVGSIAFSSDAKIDETMREYAILFAVSGCVSILQRWLENGMQESTEEMAKLILQLSYTTFFSHP